MSKAENGGNSVAIGRRENLQAADFTLGSDGDFARAVFQFGGRELWGRWCLSLNRVQAITASVASENWRVAKYAEGNEEDGGRGGQLIGTGTDSAREPALARLLLFQFLLHGKHFKQGPRGGQGHEAAKVGDFVSATVTIPQVRFDHGAGFGQGFAGKIGFHFFKLKMGDVRKGASDGGAVSGDSQLATDIRI